MDKKLSWNFLNIFFNENHHIWTIQIPCTIPKLVTHNIERWKQTLSKESGFHENATAHTFSIKVPKKHNFVGAAFLLQSNHLTGNSPSISEHPNFCSIPFQFSNMHVNLFHWNSLLLKKAILPTFLGQTTHFLSDNHKTRTYNLHHRKAWFVAVIFSQRVGVNYIQKVVK